MSWYHFGNNQTNTTEEELEKQDVSPPPPPHIQLFVSLRYRKCCGGAWVIGSVCHLVYIDFKHKLHRFFKIITLFKTIFEN